MFVKYKNKDNVFKDLIRYQKPLKTLYQQLVLKGYTDTEEEFLDKVLKITQGRERQEIDDLITLLTKNLEDTNSILNSVKTLSEKNKSDIGKNKRNINDLANDYENAFDYFNNQFDYFNNQIDSIDNTIKDINNNRLPEDGSENQVLLKGNNKNIWKSFDEIPLTLADISTDNEILAIFQIKSQPFTLGKILTEGSEIEIYIDGVLSNDLAKRNENGELTFQLANNSNKTVDIEIYGDREKDIVKYNQNFLKIITYIDEIFLNYDPYGRITWLNTPAFFSHNDNLKKVGKVVIGDKVLSYSASNIFQYDSYLEEVLEIDLGPCTNISSMFQGCLFAEDFSLLKMDTSKVTNMQGMFQDCYYITKLPQLDSSKVTDMSYMFKGSLRLTTIPQMDTKNVIEMNYMFSGCSALTNIPLLNTTNAINMSYMFEKCTSLTTIPLLDTGKVTHMGSMFSDCTSLATVPSLNTSNATVMEYMFSGCTSLARIESLNVSKATTATSMFSNCNNLSYIKLLSDNINNLQIVINELPAHEGAATDVYTIDLTECTIDVSSTTAPAGWTIKLPTSGGGE